MVPQCRTAHSFCALFSRHWCSQMNACTYTIACVASVSVGFGRKTEKGDFESFARAENGAKTKKRKVGVGEGKERNPCRQTLDFENPVRQRMGFAIGWVSRTLLTCVDQRS